MTARFRSAFYGSSGFVAARSAVRIVESAPQEPRPALRVVDPVPPHRTLPEQAKAPEAWAA